MARTAVFPEPDASSALDISAKCISKLFGLQAMLKSSTGLVGWRAILLGPAAWSPGSVEFGNGIMMHMDLQPLLK